MRKLFQAIGIDVTPSASREGPFTWQIFLRLSMCNSFMYDVSLTCSIQFRLQVRNMSNSIQHFHQLGLEDENGEAPTDVEFESMESDIETDDEPIEVEEAAAKETYPSCLIYW